MKFLRRYIFRGLGPVFVLAMLTILWTACNVATNQTQEKKARDEGKRMLDAMHKDADGEIRKYTDRQMQFGKPAKEEKKGGAQ